TRVAQPRVGADEGHEAPRQRDRRHRSQVAIDLGADIRGIAGIPAPCDRCPAHRRAAGHGRAPNLTISPAREDQPPLGLWAASNATDADGSARVQRANSVSPSGIANGENTRIEPATRQRRRRWADSGGDATTTLSKRYVVGLYSTSCRTAAKP